MEALGTETLAKAVEREGGKVKALDITPGDVAIVRTTPRGHSAIEKALKRSRG